MENTQIGKADALDTSSIKFDVVLEPMETVTGAKVPADLRRAVKIKIQAKLLELVVRTTSQQLIIISLN